jgi:hypothetical protein
MEDSRLRRERADDDLMRQREQADGSVLLEVVVDEAFVAGVALHQAENLTVNTNDEFTIMSQD